MIRAARSLASVVAVVAAVVLLTGGIGWLGHRTEGGPGVPRPTGRNLDLTLSYVGLTAAGPRLFTEDQTVASARASALSLAISAMMTDAPRDEDYRNYLFRSHLRAKASLHHDTITIDFSKTPQRTPDMSDATVRMVVQALVHTADDAVGTDLPVRFRIAGREAPSVLGVDTRSPIEAVRDATVDSPVAITSPGEYSTTSVAPTVRGSASTADGHVYWALYRKDKLTRVATGRSAEGQCCEFAPFTFTLPTLRPGSPYVLEVGDGPDLGGGRTTVDTKEFSVR